MSISEQKIVNVSKKNPRELQDCDQRKILEQIDDLTIRMSF
jgi:hypothetical protein